MSDISDNETEHSEFLDTARRLSMPKSPTPEGLGVELEDVDDLMQRLKAKHGPLPAEPTPDAPVIDLHQRRRRLAVRGSFAAAIMGVVASTAILQPWTDGSSAAADEPAVLEYEFAEAANIAFAPGEPASDVLLQLAKAAEAQSATAAASQVQYLVTDNWFAKLTGEDGDSSGVIIPTYRESWLRPDGSLVARERNGEPLSADGRTAPDAADDLSAETVTEGFPAGTQDANAAASLPTDPDQLRGVLLDRNACEVAAASALTAACLNQAVLDLANSYVLRPDQTGALWRVLAGEPAFRSLGAVTDRVGREGIGISLIPETAPNFRMVLIISPSTGQLIGTETVLIKESPDLQLEAPTIFSFTAILKAERVNDADVPTPTVTFDQ